MKKEEIAEKNRLEYLKDKVERLEKELKDARDGVREVHITADILIKRLLLKLGGEVEFETGLGGKDVAGYWVEATKGENTMRLQLKEKDNG